jgi:hypothetical protein
MKSDNYQARVKNTKKLFPEKRVSGMKKKLLDLIKLYRKNIDDNNERIRNYNIAGQAEKTCVQLKAENETLQEVIYEIQECMKGKIEK